jgi:hypothetical protein
MKGARISLPGDTVPASRHGFYSDEAKYLDAEECF